MNESNICMKTFMQIFGTVCKNKCYLFPCKEQRSVQDPRGFHGISLQMSAVGREQSAEVWRAAAAATSAAEAQTQDSVWRSQSHLLFSKHSLASSDCVEMRKKQSTQDGRNWTRRRETRLSSGSRFFGSAVKRSGPPRCPRAFPTASLAQRCSATCQL